MKPNESPDIDPSKPLRLAKHEAFAKAWAEGKNFTEAARIAGYSGENARKHGSLLGTNPDIVARKDYLATKAAEEFTMTRAQWLEELREIGQEARQAGDFAAAKGCLAEIGKACPGFYAPAQVEGTLEVIVRSAPADG